MCQLIFWEVLKSTEQIHLSLRVLLSFTNDASSKQKEPKIIITAQSFGNTFFRQKKLNILAKKLKLTSYLSNQGLIKEFQYIKEQQI